jgi:hypothetical protein
MSVPKYTEPERNALILNFERKHPDVEFHRSNIITAYLIQKKRLKELDGEEYDLERSYYLKSLGIKEPSDSYETNKHNIWWSIARKKDYRPEGVEISEWMSYLSNKRIQEKKLAKEEEENSKRPHKVAVLLDDGQYGGWPMCQTIRVYLDVVS